MKILFADTDGVMNCFNSETEDKSNAIAALTVPDLVERVLTIRKETGCIIVCSSSWRRFGANLATLLQLGVLASPNDVTPYFNTPIRGEEIASYLKFNPLVTSYAILDDHANMLESQQARFVQTVANVGITETDMAKAIELLGEG